MIVREEKTIRDEEVLEFLAGSREATFFQTPGWLRSLSSSFPRMSASYLTAREGEDLAGVMPICRIAVGGLFILSSLPFGTYGTPVPARGRAARALFSGFADISSSWRCVETRGSFYGLGEAPGVFPAEMRSEKECRVVDLSGGFDHYRSRQISRKKRQICNGCEKEGIVVRPLSDIRELRAFYDIYRRGSKGWGGVHPYPPALFDNLFEHGGDGVVFWGAFLGSKMLGGHVDMYYGDAAQAWQAAMPSCPEASGVAAYLVYRAVEEACRRGMSEFNLGSSGGDRGMIFFKESMGGAMRTYPSIEARKYWWKILRGK